MVPQIPTLVMTGLGTMSLSVTYDYNAVSGVPEPGTWMLMSAGGMLLGFHRMRRKS